MSVLNHNKFEGRNACRKELSLAGKKRNFGINFLELAKMGYFAGVDFCELDFLLKFV